MVFKCMYETRTGKCIFYGPEPVDIHDECTPEMCKGFDMTPEKFGELLLAVVNETIEEVK